MTLLLQLPPECLQHIIQYLDPKDTAVLLRVNKVVASLALPYLYNNPFHHSFHTLFFFTDNSSYSISHLIRLLLIISGQLSSPHLHKAVSVAYGLESDSDLIPPAHSPSPLNYMVHLRYLDLGRWSEAIPLFAYFSSPPDHILDYLNTPEFHSIAGLDRLLPSYIRRNLPDQYGVQAAFRVVLFRELSWTLAYPLFKQLQSLTIPVSDIKRYLEIIDQLCNLEQVWFHLDVIFEYYVGDIGLDDPEDQEIWKVAGARKEEIKQDMIQFVGSHAELFHGRLKSVLCPDAEAWPSMRQSCPAETLAQLVQALPALHNPTVINESNWMHFVASLSSTNLAHIQEVDCPLHFGPTHRQLVDNRHFLQGCRALKKMVIGSLGRGGLQWAVQEKKASIGDTSIINIHRSQDTTTSAATQSDDKGRLFSFQHDLAPLEEAILTDSGTIPFTDEIDAIAFAFSSSLTRIFARSDYEPLNLQRSLQVGQGWVELPVLSDLYMELGDTRLVIDPELLVHCPNVSVITLHDNTFEYRPQDVDQSSYCLPAHLPQLEHLSLCGWSALRFHPDTFHTTMNLTKLEIFMKVIHPDTCYIPPPPTENDGDSHQGIERPCWTWDWDLPLLTKLELTSEFAYKFQFRMLAKCPTLEKLELNIHTLEEQHTRIITMSDLFLVPAFDNFPEETGHQKQQQKQQRIVAPALQIVRMRGRWSMESPTVLAEFLKGMLPALGRLYANHWINVPLTAFLDAIRGNPDSKVWRISFDEDVFGEGPTGEEGDVEERERWREEEETRLGLIHDTEEGYRKIMGRPVMPMVIKIGRAKYWVLENPRARTIKNRLLR
ncbi:hypothetical protein BG015_011036, partial [Linnemannia schmuckeri]